MAEDAQCRIAWVTEEKIYFYIYGLENPAKSYQQFGVAASHIPEAGQSTEPYGIAAWYYPHDVTNNRFGFGVDLTNESTREALKPAAQGDGSYLLYAYAKYNDIYYPINSYLKFHISTPMVRLNHISSNGFTLYLSNLGCGLGNHTISDNVIYKNEFYFGFAIASEYEHPTINMETHNIVWSEAYSVSNDFPVTYSLSITTDELSLNNGTRYTVYPIRIFRPLLSSGDDSGLYYIIGDPNGITFTVGKDEDDPSQVIEMFDWSPEAENAINNKGLTTDVPHSDWNRLIDILIALLDARDLLNAYGYNSQYPGYTLVELAESAKMNENDTILTALRYNSITYVIDNAGPRMDTPSYRTYTVNTGDIVTGKLLEQLRVNIRACVELYLTYGY